MPCSAATVTGIVCEADAAFASATLLALAVTRLANEPEPKPSSGRSREHPQRRP